MTGIYIGAATMILWLALCGKLHRTGRFSRTMLAILALCIGVMAVDGGNALLVDLGAQPLYSPANGLRLFTGLIAGSAIGVIVAHLFAISVWQRGERRHAVVATSWELLPPLLIAGFFCGLAASGLGILYAPISLGLLLAVAITVWPLAFTMLALLCGNAWSIRRVQEMSGLAVWAHVATIAVIVLAAVGRSTLEILWQIPRLP